MVDSKPSQPSKGVCQRTATAMQCAWPRCACRVDLVYTTKIKIQRPR